MSEQKQKQATDPCELERKVLDPNVAKTEGEWWARARIEQLEAENKRLRGHIEQLREAVEEGLSTYKVPMTARICEALAALTATEPPIGDSGMVAHEVLNGGWVSFDMAQPEGPNLVQQYLGDSVLDQQNPPFWAFPTSRWRGAKELYATHWRYVQGPHE